MIEQGLRPKTVNAVLSALRSFYGFMVEGGEAEGNPVIPGRLRVKSRKPLIYKGMQLVGFHGLTMCARLLIYNYAIIIYNNSVIVK